MKRVNKIIVLNERITLLRVHTQAQENGFPLEIASKCGSVWASICRLGRLHYRKPLPGPTFGIRGYAPGQPIYRVIIREPIPETALANLLHEGCRQDGINALGWNHKEFRLLNPFTLLWINKVRFLETLCIEEGEGA